MSALLNHSPICFICRRRSSGFAVGPSPKTLGWFCDDCGTPLARKCFAMKPKMFDGYEEKALETAGENAGAYLDSLGKTDLAALSEVEWKTFLEAVVNGFGDGMRKSCAELEPPF